MRKINEDWIGFCSKSILNIPKAFAHSTEESQIFKNRFSQFTMSLKRQTIIAVLFYLIPLFCFGQNNLDVNLQGNFGVANSLNICGAADTISVRISVNENSAQPRTNILATLHLFKGVEFIELLNTSSPNVSVSNSNVTRPQFNLPTLNPNGTSFVDLEMAIRANCGFLDSLSANEQALVLDTWEFNYSMNGTSNLVEFDNTIEYRDAFLVPFFTMEITPRNIPARVGDCFNREITITNTSLGAYVEQMQYVINQEIGVTLDDILVNGVSVPFSSMPLSAMENEITVQLDGSIFQSNGNILSGNGNGDNRFDTNEFITITEVLCLQSCFLPRGSEHIASWGCDNTVCEEYRVVDFVPAGLGNPNVTIQTVANIDAGYCQSGSSALEFSNNGVEFDPGFGAMMDVSIGIGLSGSFDLSLNGYNINSLSIAGVNIPNFASLNNLNNHPSFQTDPDGMGGLDDVDGDGFYDDLPVGESVEASVQFDFDCTNAAIISHPDSCFNNFSTSFNGRIDYTNACDERFVRLQSSYYRPTNSNSGFENFTDTDAFLESGTFFVRHEESRSIRSFANDCPGGGQLVAKVVLPSGITADVNQTQLLKNGISPYDLLSSNQMGDTLHLVYGGPLTSSLSGTYDLVLAFQADCNANLGPTSFPITFEFQCPDCSCSHVWFCDELQGPWLHATNPPCPDPVLVDCPSSIQTHSFDVNRTTFGFADRNSTIPFPSDQANKKVAILCDSVQMNITNVVGDAPVTGDIGVIIGYDNVDNTDSTDQIFLFGNGVVEFHTGGAIQICPITPADINVTAVANQKEVRIDFDRCIQNLGLTLQPGDSINFSGRFSVNPEGPIGFQFRSIPNFRAYGYSLQNGAPVWCDQFGENFTLGKSNSVFDFPNSLDFPKGCEEGLLEYRLVTINNGFKDWFGDEFRTATKLDSVVIDFETTLFDAFEGGTVEAFIPGHPIYGNDYYPIKPLSDFPNGKYIALFDSLDYVPTLNDVSSSVFGLRIRLQPNCSSFSGSANGDNLYQINSRLTFVDRHYANFIGDGSCVESRNEVIEQDIEYSIPPQLNLTPASNSNFVLLSDTAYWNVQVCNTAAESDAGLTWLAIENPDNAIEVVAMTDISNPNTPIGLNVERYGDNYFAFANGLLRASGGNSFEQVCNVIRVKALVQVCGTSLLSARTGWNCEPYREPNWTPDLYAPCTDNLIPLSVSTRDPRLEADVQMQGNTNPDICETQTITILLKNVDLGSVFDLNTVLTIPPAGATFVPGSVEIAYPPSAPFQAAFGDPTLASTTTRGQNFEYNGFDLLNQYLTDEGLQGFNSVNPSDSNQIAIRYQFITDCDFVSGSLSYFSFQGQKGCQAPSNFEAGETFPLFINGATPNPNKLFEAEFGPNTFLVSNASDVEILVTNLTAIPSTTDDKIRFTLPPNVTYQNGTSIGLTPNGWTPSDPTIRTVAGLQELTWDLPAGLMQFEQAVLRLTLNTPTYDCDSPSEEAKLVTLSTVPLTCATIGTTCDIGTINSLGGDVVIDLPVGQQIGIINANLESECTGTEEMVFATFDLNSLGFSFAGQSIGINYFNDANGNNSFDNGELITTRNISTPANQSTFTLIDSLLTTPDNLCALGVFIDDSNLPICDTFYAFFSSPILRNAGAPQSFCESSPNVTTQIGATNCLSTGYTYVWSAIAPANISMLSAIDVLNPTVTIPTTGGVNEYQFVLQTTRNGCSSTQDTTTIVLGNPIAITANSPIFIPAGTSQTLTPTISGGNGNFTFEWLPPNGLSDPNIQNPIANPTNDTQYLLTVTDSLGCSENILIEVLARDPFMADVSFSDSSICVGAAIQLFASGGTDYQWIENPNNPTSGNLSPLNSANPTFSNGQSGGTYFYEVAVTDSNFPGLSDTAQVQINVGIPLMVSINSPVVIPFNTTTTLAPTVSGGIAPLTYSWSPATGLTNPNAASTDAAPNQDTQYTLTVTDAYGCQETVTVLVDLMSPVNGTVNFRDTSICEGNDLQISASGGTDYQWIPATTNPTPGNLTALNIPNPIFENGVAGNNYEFDVVVTEVALPGNADTITITIQVNSSPTAEAGFDTSICQGESTTLNGMGFGGSGNYTYEWSSGDRSANATVSPIATTQYFLTVTDATGCFDVDTVQINVTNCGCELAVVQSINIINSTCGNSDGSVEVLVANQNNYVFSLIPNAGNIISPNHINELPFGGYTFFISHTRDASCILELPFVISNVDGPQAAVSTTPATCQAADGTATLTPANFDYLWRNGTTGNSRNDLTAGNHFVTITDPNIPSCSNVMMVTIAQDNPLVANTIVNSQPDCGVRNGSVTLQITGGSGNYAYSWMSGTDTQNNLPAGTHLVNVTDLSSTGCDLPVIFVLTDNVPPANVTVTDTLHVSCPGSADGSINFDIDFDPNFAFPADTVITNGFGNFQNGNLPKGDYCMEIRDANGCVAGGVCFRIDESDPLLITASSFEKCQNGGAIDLQVSGGTSPYSFDWADLTTTPEPEDRNDLNSGIFNVAISDARGCSSNIDVFVDSCGSCNIFGSKDTLLLQANNCGGLATICLPVDFQRANQLEFFDNGVLSPQILRPCDLDTILIYSFRNLYGEGDLGPYILDSWIVDGITQIGNFNDLPDLANLMNMLDPGGNWTYEPANKTIFGGNTQNSYGDIMAMDVALGIRSNHPFNIGNPANGYAIEVGMGFHQVVINDPVQSCTDTILANVICTQPDTLNITLFVQESDTICLSGQELGGAITSFYNNCEDGTFVQYQILNDSCIAITGDSIGNELACLVVCDDYSICDTTYVNINVIPDPLSRKIIFDTISIGQIETLCCDTPQVRLVNPIATIRNICPDSSGTNVEFILDSTTNCVTYTGLEVGTDLACIEYCDSLGNCDTILVNVTVDPAFIIRDTILLNIDTVTYCFGLDTLPPIDTIYNDCPSLSGDQVMFTIDQGQICIAYYGMQLGMDTACIVLVTDTGTPIRYNFIVTVVTPMPETICDTIFLNEEVVFNVDTSEIRSQLAFIDNICPGENRGNVDFFVDPFNSQVIYEGIEVGRDSACIVACGNNGACDTTYFCLEVIDFLDRPTANGDCDTTQKNIPLVIRVGENDTLFGRIQLPTIVQAPSGGQAIVNQDGTITYVQTENFCDGSDEFIYEVCNENGCDTARVKVYVECIGITVFTAVSPNRDGINDTFYIGGLDDKPDNTLRIYNRWGNLVYEKDSYDNSWDGVFEGNELPDGTYYYIFEVNDNGDDLVFRGYLEMYR